MNGTDGWMDGRTDGRMGRTHTVAADRLDDDGGGLATSETGEGERIYIPTRRDPLGAFG